jgi:hypothetical protein
VPGHDQTVRLKNLRFEHLQLGPKSGKTRTCRLGHSFVAPIGSDIEQCLDAAAPDWRDDPELSKMSADRIDHGSLLTNKQVPRAMEHQATLLLGRLGLDKPHVRSDAVLGGSCDQTGLCQ